MLILEAELFNLTFFPGLIQGINIALKKRQAFWLIHPIMLWLMTASYIYAFFYTRLLKKIGLGYGH